MITAEGDGCCPSAPAKAISVEQARTVVSEAGFPTAVVQTASPAGGASDEISVRTKQLTNERALVIERALVTVGGDVTKAGTSRSGRALATSSRSRP